jgi:hypothetical protein
MANKKNEPVVKKVEENTPAVGVPVGVNVMLCPTCADTTCFSVMDSMMTYSATCNKYKPKPKKK